VSGGTVPVLWSIQGPKIAEFLLNPNHRKGASRWKYLSAFGFTREDERALADALVQHAMNNLPGVIQPQSEGPNRVEFRGTVRAPDGRDMPLRTVWEVGEKDGERTMRFLTAIPLTR
jgi:hypothetical protein